MTLIFSHLSNSRMQSRLDIVLKPYFPMWRCFHFLPQTLEKIGRKFFSNKNLCCQSNNKGLPLITLLYGEGKCEDPLHIVIIVCVMQNCAPYYKPTDSACILQSSRVHPQFSADICDVLLWTHQEVNKLTRLVKICLWEWISFCIPHNCWESIHSEG